MFTAESIANLPQYYEDMIQGSPRNLRFYPNFHAAQINATGPLISEGFVDATPIGLKESRFGTPVWKILANAFMMGLFGIVSIGWIWLTCRWARNSRTLQLLCPRAAAPVGILLFLQASNWFVASQINPTGPFAAGALRPSTVVAYGSAAWLAWLLIHVLAEVMTRSSTSWARADRHLLRLMAQVLGFVAISLILVLGAVTLGIPAMGLLAGFDVGGIVVAPASQSTFENLPAGLTLFVDRPFRIGDSILFEEQPATVERISPPFGSSI